MKLKEYIKLFEDIDYNKDGSVTLWSYYNKYIKFESVSDGIKITPQTVRVPFDLTVPKESIEKLIDAANKFIENGSVLPQNIYEDERNYIKVYDTEMLGGGRKTFYIKFLYGTIGASPGFMIKAEDVEHLVAIFTEWIETGKLKDIVI